MNAFVCDICRLHFEDVGAFLNHKRSRCNCSRPHVDPGVDRNRQEEEEEELRIEVVVDQSVSEGVSHDQTELTLISSSFEEGETVLGDFKIVYNEPQLDETSKVDKSIEVEVQVLDAPEPVAEGSTDGDIPLRKLKNTSSIFACRLCYHYATQEDEVLKHLLLQHGKIVVSGTDDYKNLILSLQPLQPPEIEEQITLREATPTSDVVHLQLSRNSNGSLPLGDSKVLDLVKEKRQRGRPRKNKVWQRAEELEDVSCSKKKQKNGDVEWLPGTDGLYRCDHCNRSFRRERHARSHRCFHLDPRYDFSQDGYGHNNNVEKTVAKVLSGRTSSKVDREFDEDKFENFEAEDGEVALVSHRRKYIPVFRKEEERVAFKERLNAVDLTRVDHLFSIHLIQQQITSDDCNSDKANCKQLQIFSCNVCSKVFKNISHIRLHCLVHTNLKPFRCSECPYASNTKGNLYTHVRKHTGNSYRCSQCEFRSCNRSHVTEHEATHAVQQPHMCRICSKHYRTFKSLGNHVRKYHSNSSEDGGYVASFSSGKFTGNVLHECHVCHRKFKQKIDKERHLHSHNVLSSQVVLSCGLCPYKTGRRLHLEKHFTRHRLIYCCCRCTAKYLSKLSLKDHLKKEHTSDEMNYDTMIKESVEASWFLPEPVLTFDSHSSVSEREKHVLSNEEVDTNNESVRVTSHIEGCSVEASSSVEECMVLNMIKRLKYRRMSSEACKVIGKMYGEEECDFCGRLFHSQAHLLVHRRSHVQETPFKCLKCSYSSATNNNLKRHWETVHERRRFECDTCHHISLSRTSLWHHQQKHKALISKCSECEKTFSNPTKLRQHLDLVHADGRSSTTLDSNQNINLGWFGRRSLKCPYCDRIFHRSISDLKKHIWIHEGVKPFKCSVCSYTCRSRNNLNVHMLRHSEDKPHSCLDCGRSYKSKTALRWHRKTHENGPLFRCQHCSYSVDQKTQLELHLKETHDVHICRRTENEEEGSVSFSSVSINSPIDCVANDETVTSEEIIQVYNCYNCDSFGSLSDMAHHLNVTHNVPAQNLTNLGLTELELMNEKDEETAIVPSVVTNEPCTTTADCGNTVSVASATVNVIQQIIDQGGLETGHLTLRAVPEGLQLAVNPETFVIRDDDGAAEVVVEGSLEEFEGNELDAMTFEESDCRSSRYTIQFVTEPPNGFLSGGDAT